MKFEDIKKDDGIYYRDVELLWDDEMDGYLGKFTDHSDRDEDLVQEFGYPARISETMESGTFEAARWEFVCYLGIDEADLVESVIPE